MMFGASPGPYVDNKPNYRSALPYGKFDTMLTGIQISMHGKVIVSDTGHFVNNTDEFVMRTVHTDLLPVNCKITLQRWINHNGTQPYLHSRDMKPRHYDDQAIGNNSIERIWSCSLSDIHIPLDFFDLDLPIPDSEKLVLGSKFMLVATVDGFPDAVMDFVVLPEDGVPAVEASGDPNDSFFSVQPSLKIDAPKHQCRFCGDLVRGRPDHMGLHAQYHVDRGEMSFEDITKRPLEKLFAVVGEKSEDKEKKSDDAASHYGHETECPNHVGLEAGPFECAAYFPNCDFRPMDVLHCGVTPWGQIIKHLRAVHGSEVGVYCKQCTRKNLVTFKDMKGHAQEFGHTAFFGTPVAKHMFLRRLPTHGAFACACDMRISARWLIERSGHYTLRRRPRKMKWLGFSK